jgi:hypothetical protein
VLDLVFAEECPAFADRCPARRLALAGAQSTRPESPAGLQHLVAKDLFPRKIAALINFQPGMYAPNGARPLN